RARPGDRISLFNGRDGEWLARIAEVSKRSCSLECEGLVAPQREVPDLWLCFAPIKKTPADYVVQKATELGVSVLQPVFTRRTIVTRVNLERMHANAVEAAEQSGRLSVPEARGPLRALPFVTPVSLGPRILRADTAALAALAIWQSVRGDWR